MSIHDFHSKLTSGQNEGRLFEALRKLKKLESALAMTQEEAGWYEWPALASSASLVTVSA
jgi:hypothetical protein